LLSFGYAGSSLEVKIETDSNDAMEIKKEADGIDIIQCLHHDYQYAGMFAVSDAIFSAVARLSVMCTELSLLFCCCCCVYYKSLVVRTV